MLYSRLSKLQQDRALDDSIRTAEFAEGFMILGNVPHELDETHAHTDTLKSFIAAKVRVCVLAG